MVEQKKFDDYDQESLLNVFYFMRSSSYLVQTFRILNNKMSVADLFLSDLSNLYRLCLNNPTTQQEKKKSIRVASIFFKISSKDMT